MPSTVYVGLAVTSNAATATATATFSNVAVAAPTSTNKPPTVALSAPAGGSTYTAPASVTLTATAGDVDGSISKVDFYAGTQLVGSDTSSPYSVTWSNVAAGSYSLTAVATDNDGATTTSQAVPVTVERDGQQTADRSAFGAGSRDDVNTAPASITLTAATTDTDGTIAKVDFYAGTQLVRIRHVQSVRRDVDERRRSGATASPRSPPTTPARRRRQPLSSSRSRHSPRFRLQLSFTPGGGLCDERHVLLSGAPPRDRQRVRHSCRSRNIGKPAIVSGTISVDISSLVDPLPAGSYYAVDRHDRPRRLDPERAVRGIHQVAA